MPRRITLPRTRGAAPRPADNPPLGSKSGDDLLGLTQVERIATEHGRVAAEGSRAVEHDARVDALVAGMTSARGGAR